MIATGCLPPALQKGQRRATCLLFLNGILKHVFTFVSPLFVWNTSPLGYIHSAKKGYNRQSPKSSTSVTERTLYLVVDFIFLSGNVLHLTIIWSRSHCTTIFFDIICNHVGVWGDSVVHLPFSFDFKYLYLF